MRTCKKRTFALFPLVYTLIFTKLSENVERLVGYTEITTARSRDVAMVTDFWRVLAKIHNCWEDRNVDYCISLQKNL